MKELTNNTMMKKHQTIFNSITFRTKRTAGRTGYHLKN